MMVFAPPARVHTPDDVDLIRDAITATLLSAGHKQRGASIAIPCPAPTHDDRHPSASWHVEKGAWVCYSRGCQEHFGGGTLALARLLGVTLDDGELPPAVVEAAHAAREVARLDAERSAVEHAAALDRVVSSGYDRDCTDRLFGVPPAMELLSRHGLTREAMALFSFGLDPSAPVRGRWPALVWPWILGYQPVSFQYRNLTPDHDHGDRYRWHGAIGANGARLYAHAGIRAAGKGPIVVVEGLKKAATLWGHGWQNIVAYANSGSLDAGALAMLAATGEDVLFCPDPDTIDSTRERARSLPGARIAVLPQKPDDLLVVQGAFTLRRYLDLARAA